uniref:Reverse transcriptase domain-containing protein n=1 Tax=Tanacetum cinerariifolium TaxID=118510 RepID=A0A6L2LS93_TANCI|nr:hypothetical protein [Tanacetum cinerariifolium]
MGYEHLSITPETESDEFMKSNAKNLLPIPSECEVTSEDNDELVCDTFSDSKIDDDISVYDDDFKDIEYVEASLLDPEIVSIEEENSVEEENVVQREEEESDNSLLDNFLPEFETFCDHSEETRSGNTTHANYSLSRYDSFCFEIEPDQERSRFIFSNNSIPPGIENIVDDPEGDIRFLEELLIDDSILSHELSDANFEDNPSILRPPPEPPNDNFDLEPEVISAVMEDIDEPDEHFNLGG